MTLGAVPDLISLRTTVSRCEQWGVDGILISDHLFMTLGRPRREAALGADPYTCLAIVGATSDRLELGTLVSNLALQHPALVLRHFAQLACLFGGDRVLAGLGAGWNREELEGLGMVLEDHPRRMTRLEEGAELARRLFDDGWATLDGVSVSAAELPLAPRPDTAPRLLLGGGSDRLLDIAGRFADDLNLYGASAAATAGGATAIERELRRVLRTTVGQLERSVARVRAAAVGAGRPAGVVSLSTTLPFVAFCRADQVATHEAAFSAGAGLPPAPLDDCPHVLCGEPARMRDVLAERVERLSLSALVIAFGPQVERLADEVLS